MKPKVIQKKCSEDHHKGSKTKESRPMDLEVGPGIGQTKKSIYNATEEMVAWMEEWLRHAFFS